MTMNRRLVIALAALAALVLAAPTRVALADEAGLMQRNRAVEIPAQRAEKLLAEARLHAELGSYEEAAAAYRRLFDDAEQSPLVRGRARLGEGVMLRALGNEYEFFGCFFEVLEIAQAERSVELAREIITTAGGVLPTVSSWEAMEPLLAFERRSNAQGREVLVRPPGFMPRVVTDVRTVDGETEVVTTSMALGVDARYTGEPISVAFKDADLQDLFRMFKQISGLNIIVSSELKGRTITLDVTDVPWDQVMALVMKTNGLGSEARDNVLFIAPLEQIAREAAGDQGVREALDGPVRPDTGAGRADAPTYTGQPISVSFKDADLEDLFRVFGDTSGRQIIVDPSVHGETITIDVHEVPWDQVMALVLKTNGLEAHPEGDATRVVRGPGAPRVRRAQTVTAIDLSGETRSIARTLSHADPQLAFERVTAQMSPRGTVRLDRRTNTLIVKDLVLQVDAIEQLLDELDVEPASAGGFTGEPISISFQDADLGDIFQLFGQISGLDFVLDDRVTGVCDLVTSDEPWDSVLRGLLVEHDLIMIPVGERLYVMPRPADDVLIAEHLFAGMVIRIGRPDDGW